MGVNETQSWVFEDELSLDEICAIPCFVDPTCVKSSPGHLVATSRDQNQVRITTEQLAFDAFTVALNQVARPGAKLHFLKCEFLQDVRIPNILR